MDEIKEVLRDFREFIFEMWVGRAILAFIVFMAFMLQWQSGKMADDNRAAFDAGRAAQKAGIPPEACDISTGNTTRPHWMRGWQAGLLERKDAAK